MSTRTIVAPRPAFETPPVVRAVQRALRWFRGRVSPVARSAERALAVEERVGIGPKKSMVLVRCYGQRFLVATSGDTVGPLIEVAGPKPSKPARRVRRGADGRERGR